MSLFSLRVSYGSCGNKTSTHFRLTQNITVGHQYLNNYAVGIKTKCYIAILNYCCVGLNALLLYFIEILAIVLQLRK
jgi:hypothetical protein